MDRLTERVWLGDSGDGPAMIRAGAHVLLDLRAEATPPAYVVPVEHFPLQDLAAGQQDVLDAAARRVKALVDAGATVGIYCHAGVSRTAAVAMAYLMLEGEESLDAARRRLAACRPRALPAVGLWRDLEAWAGARAHSEPAHENRRVAGLGLHWVHRSGSGPPLVLLHGAYGSWRHWQRNLDGLAQAFDVWALDLPGFGESDDWPADFVYAAYVDLIGRAVRDLALGPVVLGGYSFGAALAARLASEHPSLVDSLLLVAPVGRAGDPAGHHRIAERHFRPSASLDERLAVVRDNLAALHFYEGRRLREDERTVRMTYLNIVRTRLGPRRMRAEGPRVPLLEVLRGLPGSRTLMVWGAHDPFCQPSVDAWAKACRDAVPGARWALVAEASHWCQYERPAEFNRLVAAWTARVPAARRGGGGTHA